MSMWISNWRVVLKSIKTNVYSSCDHSYWLIHLFSRLNLSVSGLRLRPLNGSSYDRFFSEHQSWAWSHYSRFRLNLSPLTGSNMLVNSCPMTLSVFGFERKSTIKHKTSMLLPAFCCYFMNTSTMHVNEGIHAYTSLARV